MENDERVSELRAKLKEAMGQFIGPFEHYGQITGAVKNLEEVFFTLTGLDPFSRPSGYDGESRLDQGVAIAPNFAGMCVREFMRTWHFIKGMYLGIKAAADNFPGQRLHVLYAGCGPFAPLFIPLTACFSPREMGFTLLDIHPQSIQCVEKLIAGLGISGYVDDCRVADALRFSPPPGKMYHLAVTETMNQALRKEPQVAITRRLFPFLYSQGIFIPQRVTVSAAVTDYDRQFPERQAAGPEAGDQNPLDKAVHPPRIDLGTIFELIPGQEDYPAATFHVPPLKNKENHLLLLTEITVFDGLVLTEGQCSLTLPYKYGRLHKLPPAERYVARYEVSSLPGIIIAPAQAR